MRQTHLQAEIFPSIVAWGSSSSSHLSLIIVAWGSSSGIFPGIILTTSVFALALLLVSMVSMMFPSLHELHLSGLGAVWHDCHPRSPTYMCMIPVLTRPGNVDRCLNAYVLPGDTPESSSWNTTLILLSACLNDIHSEQREAFLH